jgi:hypothetical protein
MDGIVDDQKQSGMFFLANARKESREDKKSYMDRNEQGI